MNGVVVAITALAVAVPAAAAVHTDRRASLAAYATVDAVLTSPRCQNCHTLTDYPRQGDDRHPHRLNVQRGVDGRGAMGMRCSVCHGRANNPASGVPGADEDWRLAPLSMGWEGLSPAERCRHLKDPRRNGGRTGDKVVDHLRTHLVTWAWSESRDAHGGRRAPPPVGYDAFVKAAETWIRTGAQCPG